MPTSATPVAGAAAILAARRKAGEQGPRLPEWCRPADIDTALAIQAAVTGLLGERIAGWKCGLSADHPVIAAPIHAGTVHTGNPCPVRVRAGQVRVEPELAFILGSDLPARDMPYTPGEVDAAIARTHLALELIDSRYTHPAEAAFAENLADGLLNSGLFLGPEVDSGAARAAAAMAIRVAPATGEAILLEGTHPNGDPRAPLYWLAEFLRGQGLGLQAGQAVITGSYAGSFAVPAGQRVAIRYGALGELSVRFAH